MQADDALVAVSASGGAAYVLGAVAAAKAAGAVTVGLVCNGDTPLSKCVHIAVILHTGAEVIAGSTRLKAGTAQKMALNMISTGAMLALHKCYGNLMVGFNGDACEKLRRRAANIVALQMPSMTSKDIDALLNECSYDCRVALIVAKCQVSVAEARHKLQETDGNLRDVIG